jgi:hypothetical protein
MGFNHCYLPDVKSLQSELNTIGLECFVKRYQKYEMISGESDRMQFVESKINLYENIKNNNTNFINNFN